MNETILQLLEDWREYKKRQYSFDKESNVEDFFFYLESKYLD